MNNIEKIELVGIIENYRIMHVELDTYEQDLHNIQSGKSDQEISSIGEMIKNCINRLNSERRKEKDLLSDLEKKYGKGEIDLATLEYKTTK
jgi:DNA polymerase/3'-5' exonuclease PolX